MVTRAVFAVRQVAHAINSHAGATAVPVAQKSGLKRFGAPALQCYSFLQASAGYSAVATCCTFAALQPSETNYVARHTLKKNLCMKLHVRNKARNLQPCKLRSPRCCQASLPLPPRLHSTNSVVQSTLMTSLPQQKRHALTKGPSLKCAADAEQAEQLHAGCSIDSRATRSFRLSRICFRFSSSSSAFFFATSCDGTKLKSRVEGL